RVVPHQNREQLDRVLIRFDQLPGLGQHEKRMERVLNAVERLLVSQPFTPRQAVESSPVDVHESSHPVEKAPPGFTRRDATVVGSRHSPGGGRRLGHMIAGEDHGGVLQGCLFDAVGGRSAVLQAARDGRRSAPVTRLTSVMESNGKSMAAWAFWMATSSGPDMKQNALPSRRFTCAACAKTSSSKPAASSASKREKN